MLSALLAAAACALLAIALSAGGRTWAIDQSIAWRSQPWINGPSSEAAWGLRRAQSDLATAEAALPAAQQADREAAQRHAEATPAAADEVPEEGRRHRRRRRHRRDEVPQVPSPPTPTAPSIAERIRELRGSTIPGYEAEVARQRSREAAYRASFDRETEEREREEALSLAAAIAAAVASVAALVLGRRSPPIPPPANALL